MLKQKFKPILDIIHGRVTKVGIIVAIIAAIIFLLAYAFWPRTFSFAYQQQTCIDKVIFFPDNLQFQSDGFKVEATNKLGVAGITLLSKSVCASPIETPKPGSYTVTEKLFGKLPVNRARINVSSYPVASVSIDKPIPVTQPLKIDLNAADEVFTYKIHTNKASTQCYPSGKKLDCQFQKLKLSQGKKYDLHLVRYFKDKKISTVAKEKITTLTATTVTDSSIKPAATVYEKPKTTRIVFDKPVATVEAKLFQVEGNKEIKVIKNVNKTELELNWKTDLKRLAAYRLVIDKVVAKDGSSLVEPYVLEFKTSGGPKVAQVSVGSSKVALGSTATLTFDQSLADKQDMAKAIVVSGGAVVTGFKGNEVYISLAGVPKCGEVSIKVNARLQSIHQVAGGSDWSYKTRMICYGVETIGYSVAGRPINAYIFGNGPQSVIYTGAIHGNEGSTYSLMNRWIDELDANAQAIPADRTAIVIPSINPDGLANGSRVNSNNVDLNRNFATSDWSKDITTVSNTPFLGGGGEKATSEPETRAVAGYVARVNPRLVLSYHSIGALLESNLAADASNLAQSYANLSGYRNATGSAGTFEYSYSGTADDYYGQILGIPSILIELGSHSYHQFEQNQKAMWSMLTQ